MMSDEDMIAVNDDVYQIHALLTGSIRCFDPLDAGTAFSLCKIACEFTDNLLAFLNERI